MALIVDQQSNFKYYCKICKKGFGCGRALGGHMRAHGIGEDSDPIDYDDDDDDHVLRGNNNNDVPPSNKCMYALRANPNRLKSCRVCENCGKEFLCWKSFLEHGKCSSYEEAESLVSSPGSDGDDGTPRRGCGWSKRKRSLRAQVDGDFNPNCPSSEEEDLANCLMMLSNATVLDPLDAEPEESCASASREEERIRNTMNFTAPIACKSVPMDHKAKGLANNKGLFECKACKKVFNSHQALGGHRASHKKVKGCFAARLDHMDDSLLAEDQDHDVITHEEFFPTKSTSTMQFDHHGTNNNYNPSLGSSSKRKSKVHECSICHRVFSSGQALGGHKRCHWITSNSPADTTSLAKLQQYHHNHVEQIQQIPKLIDNSDPLDLKLDLNLPAPNDDHTGGGRREHVSMEVSTDIYLQPWIGVNNDDAKEKAIDNQHNQEIESDQTNCNTSLQNNNVDDEANNKVKLAKLSELKDINISGGSSPWLQVGIGSATDVEDDQ